MFVLPSDPSKIANINVFAARLKTSISARFVSRLLVNIINQFVPTRIQHHMIILDHDTLDVPHFETTQNIQTDSSEWADIEQ